MPLSSISSVRRGAGHSAEGKVGLAGVRGRARYPRHPWCWPARNVAARRSRPATKRVPGDRCDASGRASARARQRRRTRCSSSRAWRAASAAPLTVLSIDVLHNTMLKLFAPSLHKTLPPETPQRDVAAPPVQQVQMAMADCNSHFRAPALGRTAIAANLRGSRSASTAARNSCGEWSVARRHEPVSAAAKQVDRHRLLRRPIGRFDGEIPVGNAARSTARAPSSRARAWRVVATACPAGSGVRHGDARRARGASRATNSSGCAEVSPSRCSVRRVAPSSIANAGAPSSSYRCQPIGSSDDMGSVQRGGLGISCSQPSITCCDSPSAARSVVAGRHQRLHQRPRRRRPRSRCFRARTARAGGAAGQHQHWADTHGGADALHGGRQARQAGRSTWRAGFPRRRARQRAGQ